MIVRFDSKVLRQTVAQQVAPIGVEGDDVAGISEVDNIVAEAGKSLKKHTR